MNDPVIVEVTRGNVIESRHRGAIAVVDAGGAVRASVGDIAQVVFPRSAVKAIQALPLVESGAADALGFGNRELALACASHHGEPDHAALAADMLARVGLDVSALECGTHWPTSHAATIALARAGAEPCALHNNCSGKHAGFVCTCRHIGIAHRGYVGIGHAYQRMIAETMAEVTGARHDATNAAIDGCAIPTYAIPLEALANGFARMGTGACLGAARAAAARRLFAACMAEPFCISGTDGADTAMLRAGQGRVFLKVGAEGVYCGAVPELGLGFALKIDDGAERAAQVAVAALLVRLLGADDLAPAFEARTRAPVVNRNGEPVGEVRALAV